VIASLIIFLQQAWGALVAALLIVVILALLAQALRTATGIALGASSWTQEAISAAAGILLLAGFALLGVPAIVRAASLAAPGCGGPLDELGQVSAQAIGGIVAVRMLRSVFIAVAQASLGGRLSISNALLEAAEAVFGMLLIGLAAPLANHFLGVGC
jgi:hypothetical protein